MCQHRGCGASLRAAQCGQSRKWGFPASHHVTGQ